MDKSKKPARTGDPQNPWGFNREVTEPQTYRGIDIPVIGPDSSKEDLFQYIRILEDRLNLTHVYVSRPDDLPSSVQDVGVVLPYDLPPEERQRPGILKNRFVRVSMNQSERAYTLASGIDRVGCLEIGEKLYSAQNRANHEKELQEMRKDSTKGEGTTS